MPAAMSDLLLITYLLSRCLAKGSRCGPGGAFRDLRKRAHNNRLERQVHGNALVALPGPVPSLRRIWFGRVSYLVGKKSSGSEKLAENNCRKSVEAKGLEPSNLLTASQALYQLSYAPGNNNSPGY